MRPSGKRKRLTISKACAGLSGFFSCSAKGGANFLFLLQKPRYELHFGDNDQSRCSSVHEGLSLVQQATWIKICVLMFSVKIAITLISDSINCPRWRLINLSVSVHLASQVAHKIK